MKTKRLVVIAAAALGLSACGIIDMDAPCYSCGQSYYDPTPCTYDYNGNPSPGCYDYLFEDDQGNPLPPVAQPYDEPAEEPEG